MPHPIARTKGVILIGGPNQGTRFRPLSLKCPKPFFPIAGVPMIQHHVDALAKVAGMSEILLIGYHAESEVSNFIAQMAKNIVIKIRYLREYDSLGTGGGLYHFRDQILRGNPNCVFVLNCDICCDFPLNEMLEFHSNIGDGKHNTILSVTAKKDQCKHYGVMVFDENHVVQHYAEKPETFISEHINSGIYLFSPEVFDTFKTVFLRNHDDDVVIDKINLETDILAALAGTGSLYTYPSTTFWAQIKTPGLAVYANGHYLATLHNKPNTLAQNSESSARIVGDVLIDSTAIIDPTAKIGPNVTIGSGVRIGYGVRIRDAIILNNVILLSHSVVLNAIIGWDSVVGQWTRVEGHHVGHNPNNPATMIAYKPLFNKDGRLEPSITILGEGVKIQDEVIVRNSVVLPFKELNQSYHNEIIL